MFTPNPDDDGLTPQQRRSYEAYLLEVEAEDEQRRRMRGLARCPECGQRSVRRRVFTTSRYDGRADTQLHCENPLCDYSEITPLT